MDEKDGRTVACIQVAQLVTVQCDALARRHLRSLDLVRRPTADRLQITGR
jgi:hypothetical protein